MGIMHQQVKPVLRLIVMLIFISCESSFSKVHPEWFPARWGTFASFQATPWGSVAYQDAFAVNHPACRASCSAVQF